MAWPFRTKEEENLLDVRKKLAAAEGGAGLRPQERGYWRALPPEQRTPGYTAGAELPPGFQRTEAGEVAYWKNRAAEIRGGPPGVADQATPERYAQARAAMPGPAAVTTGLPPGAPPMGTRAEEAAGVMAGGSNIVAEAGVPLRQGFAFASRPDPARAPGAVAAREAGRAPERGIYDELLAGHREMRLTRGDDGSMVQVTKDVFPGGAPTPISGAPPGVAPVSAPGAPPGAPISGPPPGAAPISGPPPAPGPLTPTAADPFPARRVTARGQMTQEEREAAERQPLEDQMRRERMAGQAAAATAKYAIPAAARVESAQIGAQAERDIAQQKVVSDQVIQTFKNLGQLDVANTYALQGKDRAQIDSETDLAVAQLNNEGKVDAARILAESKGKIDAMIWLTANEEQRNKIVESLSRRPAAAAAPAGEVTGALDTFPDEASARAAGKRTGDLIIVGGTTYRLD